MKTISENIEVDELKCKICEGNGCTVCNGTGIIQINKHKPGGGHIVFEGSDMEQDKHFSELGQLMLPSTIARKQYSIAYTFYKELRDMLSKIHSKEFVDAMDSIIQEVVQHELDGFECVQDTLGIIKDFRNQFEYFEDRVKLMASHFDSALDVMHRDLQQKIEKIEDMKKELEVHRRLTKMRSEKYKEIVKKEVGLEKIDAIEDQYYSEKNDEDNDDEDDEDEEKPKKKTKKRGRKKKSKKVKKDDDDDDDDNEEPDLDDHEFKELMELR